MQAVRHHCMIDLNELTAVRVTEAGAANPEDQCESADCRPH